jgi:hypothetical protein
VGVGDLVVCGCGLFVDLRGIGSGYALPLLPPTNHRRPLIVFASGLICGFLCSRAA